MSAKILSCLLPLGLIGCSSCFVARTLVETPRGPRPIETIAVGDIVWSFSLERGERVARRVRAILRNKAREVRTIRAGGRVVAGVTSEHPFYDWANGAYRAVRDLVVGDVLASLEGESLRPCSIESVTSVETTEPSFDVYNLTIDGPEANYFAEGILVHNKEGPDPSCPSELVTVTAHANDADASIAGAHYHGCVLREKGKRPS
jgi:hypothetical protein